MPVTTIDGHHDAVAEDNKHAPIHFGDEVWTFEHLQAFVMRMPIEQSGGSEVEVDVVVLFSNHCFSREVAVGEIVDEAVVVMDGSKRRVLDKQRYALSRQYFPQLVRDLPTRHIRIADASRPNFVTIELQPEVPGSEVRHYVERVKNAVPCYFEACICLNRRHKDKRPPEGDRCMQVSLPSFEATHSR